MGETIKPAELLEALAACLEANDHRSRRQQAVALLSGPLVPLITEAAEARASLQQVTAERDEARAENNRFRAGLANGSGPCAYCNLSREDWTKCRSGFPGCDRADDAMLCPHFGAEMEANDRADTATFELARARAEGEALKADRDDAIRMLDIWFDTSTKTNEQVVPQLVDALVGYLRTCRCGGMPAETSDMIEAGAADFIRRRAGYIIAPVIEAMVAERTASLRAEGEAKGARCTYRASFKAWFAQIENAARTALARPATAREG